MQIISSDEVPVQELAQLALDSHLYHSPGWTIIRCFQDVISEPDIADTSKILLLQDDEQKNIGTVFFNDDFNYNYWGTNIQMYVKPEHRGNGYAKTLFIELNKRLKKCGWDGTIYSGYGIGGSDTFWGQMNSLHEEKPDDFYKVVLTY